MYLNAHFQKRHNVLHAEVGKIPRGVRGQANNHIRIDGKLQEQVKGKEVGFLGRKFTRSWGEG